MINNNIFHICRSYFGSSLSVNNIKLYEGTSKRLQEGDIITLGSRVFMFHMPTSQKSKTSSSPIRQRNRINMSQSKPRHDREKSQTQPRLNRELSPKPKSKYESLHLKPRPKKPRPETLPGASPPKSETSEHKDHKVSLKS